MLVSLRRRPPEAMIGDMKVRDACCDARPPSMFPLELSRTARDGARASRSKVTLRRHPVRRTGERP
jgi:hypothetical protein